MSRIRNFTLLAAVVALTAALAACGGSNGSDEDPQTVIENATLQGVESGSLDISLEISSEGDEGGEVDLGLSGPFQSRGAETLPEFDFQVSAKGDIDGESIDFDGGLTLLSDRAFVGFGGSEYEVDPTTFGFVRSGFEQGLAETGVGGAESSACQQAVAGIDLTTVIDNLENDGGAEVDGTSTTKVSGDLNPAGAIDAVIALTKDPACSAAFGAAGPLPVDELEAAKDEVAEAVERAHAEVYVGEDGIIRKVVGELTVEPKDASGEKVEMTFEMSLSGVNEKQEIEPPAGAKPLQGLFRELGVNPLALLEGLNSEAGLGGLLEALGGSEGQPEAPGAGASTEYLDCLSDAKTVTDLEKCGNLVE